uniref:Uncharacterized protein n=1 Tax=Zooxanthella nutricula TaxID=1333877 RepID=A0A7S2IQJ6_9DINO
MESVFESAQLLPERGLSLDSLAYSVTTRATGVTGLLPLGTSHAGASVGVQRLALSRPTAEAAVQTEATMTEPVVQTDIPLAAACEAGTQTEAPVECDVCRHRRPPLPQRPSDQPPLGALLLSRGKSGQGVASKLRDTPRVGKNPAPRLTSQPASQPASPALRRSPKASSGQPARRAQSAGVAGRANARGAGGVGAGALWAKSCGEEALQAAQPMTGARLAEWYPL